MHRGVRLLCAALGCVAVAGCSGLSSSSSSSPSEAATAPPASPPVTAPAKRHKTAAAKRHKTAPARRRVTTTATRPGAAITAPALPVSTASSSVVQPQPPSGSCHARGSGLFSLPDAHCTPGAISSAVTQANIDSTICSHGYTETVRPSESVTEREKEASLGAYGDNEPLHYYEYDHLVPLELGGATNDTRNLWPEPGASPNPKDELENRLRSMVCDGQLTLSSAQREIAGNWVTAYHRLVG